MTTRPLDLASKLRPPPANFDWLFLVNVGLIALFFGLFGSPFVRAPSLGVNFRLPEMIGTDPQPATHFLNVTDSGQILVVDGSLNMEQLNAWLATQAAELKLQKHPAPAVLLVRASANVPAYVLTEIFGMAQKAGFAVRQGVEESKDTPRAERSSGGR
jgi:biopolymer transport protein ExbD